MEIRKAEWIDSDIVVGMLKDTALWLNEQGSSQWADVLEGTDKHDLLGAIKKGDVYLFTVAQQVVGMAAVWNTPTDWDKELWQSLDFPERSYYIHRLIVHPAYRGKSYGSQMLTILKSHFSDIADELRLDCISTNPKLISLYSRNGFTNKGTVKESKGGEFELFSYQINQQKNN